MDVGDRAAALAHEVVVRMFVRGLVVRAVRAELRAKQKPLLDEKRERAVDGGRIDARQFGPDVLDDVVGAQVSVEGSRRGTRPR